MDENEARETEAEETQEEETGGEEATTEEVEHDWGAIEARIDELENHLNEVTEALATISIEKEEPEGEPETEYGEDGEALDLPELEQMLGL